MTKSTEYDFLVLGQGLAGSLLSWRLMQQGQRVMLIDDQHKSSSSMVAAGLINPLAGWRLVLPPEVSGWLEAAVATYRELEHIARQPLYHALDMLRLFHNAEQLRFWDRLQQQVAAREYYEPAALSAADLADIQAPFGGFLQHRTGYVDLPALLNFLHQQFLHSDALTTAELDYANIRLDADGVSWQHLHGRQLICCEGWRAQHNPWFGWLPFTPDKGEFLTLQGSNVPGLIINGRHMAVPLAGGGMRFGSTHEHERLDNHPTPAARQQLLTGVQHMFKDAERFRLTAHQAGVRPATQDRQPLLGTHPEFKQLHIFNGFGAKGTLTIPWHAQCFTRYLLQHSPLPNKVSITRCPRN